MILITSAAYVTPGLVSEFGKLPPCMLPVQNRRLYMHQINLLAPFHEDIVLTIPQDFVLPKYDQYLLNEMNISVVYVPNNLVLGASIVYALNVLARFNETLKILHGDTLISSIPSRKDMCAVAKARDEYNWNYVLGLNNPYVYAGYFSFSSQAELIRCITEKSNDFIRGVEAYNHTISLSYVEVSVWLDFGLVNSYYRSKSKMTTQRAFNDLIIDQFSVKKYSEKSDKIQAEANWFLQIPADMKHFIPALWSQGQENDKSYYEIEYFYLSSLSDLFVFAQNPFFVWRNILDACSSFIDSASLHTPDCVDDIARKSVQLYGYKTKLRLNEYCEYAGIELNEPWIINGRLLPSLTEILEDVSGELSECPPEFIHIMHGDFCFSNILFDFKSQSIKVIDPRGIDTEGHCSIWGDIRYDVAKLAHSVLGLYDFIIGGLYECVQEDMYRIRLTFPVNDQIRQVQAYFLTMRFAGYSVKELHIYPILVHLFLSMLPLHADRPKCQQAMLANALRLYSDYKK